jgi:hypothetical protein
MHSADGVPEAFPHPAVGDQIGYGPNVMRVASWTRSVRSPGARPDSDWVCLFILREQDGGTRLISRNRFRLLGLKDPRRSSWSA